MTKKEVIAVFNSLARSQGSYGRLLESLREAKECGTDLRPFWRQFRGCKGAVDVVMKVEG